jgi:hypothetical protein
MILFTLLSASYALAATISVQKYSQFQTQIIKCAPDWTIQFKGTDQLKIVYGMSVLFYMNFPTNASKLIGVSVTFPNRTDLYTASWGSCALNHVKSIQQVSFMDQNARNILSCVGGDLVTKSTGDLGMSYIGDEEGDSRNMTGR